MANMTKAQEYERAMVLKNHPRQFEISIRWDAQHELVERIMATEQYDVVAGIDEVRAAIAHSYRIKAQAFVSGLMYSKAGLKKKPSGNNLSETMDYLDDAQIEEIKEAVIDWKYDCKTPQDGSAKQKATAEKYINSLSEEEKMALFAKYMQQ